MSGTRRKPGPLGPWVDGYRVRLLELEYSPLTVTHSLGALGHLGRWMAREGLDVGQLDDDAVRRFLAAHVKDRGRLPTASVVPLLEYLRREGVVAPQPAGPMTPLDRLIGEYRDWLLVTRALAPSTVRGCVALARRFLAQRISPQDELGVEHLAGSDVTGFLLGECARVRAASAGCYAIRLRSILRFLGVRGLADPGLVACVPSVARWRVAGLPQFPPRLQIERLLSSVRVIDRVLAGRVISRSSRCSRGSVCVRSRSPGCSSRICTGEPARLRSTARPMSVAVCRYQVTSAKPSSAT